MGEWGTIGFNDWRRTEDSNPWGLAPQLISSQPPSTARPVLRMSLRLYTLRFSAASGPAERLRRHALEALPPTFYNDEEVQ